MTHRFLHIALALLLAAGFAACADDDFPERQPQLPEHALAVRPVLFRGQTTETQGTRALVDDTGDVKAGDQVRGRDELRENFFGSLDVFVKRSADADDANWFHDYHLRAGQPNVAVNTEAYDGKSLLDQAKQLLAENWSGDGYVPGVSYDIYVTANNPQTIADAATLPQNLNDLKALKTYTYNIMRRHSDTPPSGAEPQMTDDAQTLSGHKEFIMDGKQLGWQVDPATSQQVFDVEMSRAAAKIVVNVSFSKEQSCVLVGEEDGDTPERDELGRIKYGSIAEYLDKVNRSPGLPRWKYVNFACRTADVADGTFSVDLNDTGDGIDDQADLQTHGSNYSAEKQGDASVRNIDDTFTITTYSYPTDWSTEQGKAPYLLLSVFYADNVAGENARAERRSYYRIPICDERTTKKLERNHIYIVNAQIASMGSTNEELASEDEQLRIEYHVIPWTETNLTQEATTVKITDTKYFMVTPTEYTLKGDDTQSVDLQYFASVSTDDGRYIDLDKFLVSYVNYQGNTTYLTGTIDGTEYGSVQKQVQVSENNWQLSTADNTDGTKNIRYILTAPSTVTASGETVTLTVRTDGIITVESEALASRAVKNIEFDVKLLNSTLDAEHVKIEHFPMDNIQSISGSWSSRQYRLSMTDFQYDSPKPEWGSDYYHDQVEEMYTYQQYQNSPSTISRRYEYRSSAYLTYNGTAFPEYDSEYNSEANAYLYNNWYYWRTGTYYNPTFHRAQYYAIRDRYYIADKIYDWVDWERDENQTYSAATVKITADDSYQAKVWNPADGNIYGINVSENYRYTRATSQAASQHYVYHETEGRKLNTSSMNLNNNHMYVIQVTTSSDQYVLGKPTLDANFQSDDKVVSPAFMIASQLGATTEFTTPLAAALHCGTYMEVGTDGTRYTGWRLPTEQEIEFIINYQKASSAAYNKTIAPVLTGYGYWALNGTQKYTENTANGSQRVRCIRDLSLEEVNKVNNGTLK